MYCNSKPVLRFIHFCFFPVLFLTTLTTHPASKWRLWRGEKSKTSICSTRNLRHTYYILSILLQYSGEQPSWTFTLGTAGQLHPLSSLSSLAHSIYTPICRNRCLFSGVQCYIQCTPLFVFTCSRHYKNHTAVLNHWQLQWKYRLYLKNEQYSIVFKTQLNRQSQPKNKIKSNCSLEEICKQTTSNKYSSCKYSEGSAQEDNKLCCFLYWLKNCSASTTLYSYGNQQVICFLSLFHCTVQANAGYTQTVSL